DLDKNGGCMLQNTKAIKHTYALKRDAEFKAKILENHFEGLQLRIDENEVWSKLVGSFNAYNLLAIYATTILLDMDKVEALKNISVLKSVEGRFQYHVSENNCVIIVDYAHTPDALENVLHTIADIRTGNETVFTVVGCGGDRDPAKRPLMANIAAKNSNKVILTSDNPRTEDPSVIIQQMEEGVPAEMYAKVTSNVDRKQAIKNALQMAKPKDIILIAGKGHEKYQEINGKKNPFDDMAIAKELITLLNKYTMLYYFFYFLDNNYDLPGSGLYQYLSFRASLAVILSLFIAIFYGKRIINYLKKKQIGETVRDLGLEGQDEKAGTPTMGGIIIIIATLIPVLL